MDTDGHIKEIFRARGRGWEPCRCARKTGAWGSKISADHFK